jgi:hypothetical protein
LFSDPSNLLKQYDAAFLHRCQSDQKYFLPHSRCPSFATVDYPPSSKMVNRVLKSATIKTIFNNGRPLKLKYATETETWRRPYLAPNIQENFAKAMEKARVPFGATTAIMT